MYVFVYAIPLSSTNCIIYITVVSHNIFNLDILNR